MFESFLEPSPIVKKDAIMNLEETNKILKSNKVTFGYPTCFQNSKYHIVGYGGDKLNST